MERKLYASIVEKNPSTCEAAQKNVQYEYYSAGEVRKIENRIQFFDTVQNKFKNVDEVKNKIDGIVVSLDSDPKKEKFEADKLELPGNAGQPELEKRLINTMRDLKNSLENEIQASDVVDGELQVINNTVMVNPVYQANEFILPLDDAGSMWSTKYAETLIYNAEIKSNKNAPGKLLESITLWIAANEFRETKIAELAGLYILDNPVRQKDNEIGIRAAYPITYWTAGTAKAAELLNKIAERKGYLQQYATAYATLNISGSITQQMLDDGYTPGGENFPDVKRSWQQIRLLDAIVTLQTAITQVQATNTTVDQAIDQYRVLHGNGTTCADDVQLAALRLKPTAKVDITQLSIDRKLLIDTYKKYLPLQVADNSINMAIATLQQYIKDREALFDKYIKAFGQDGNTNFATVVYKNNDVEINKKIKDREDVLAKAAAYYTQSYIKKMEQDFSVDTSSFDIAVDAKIKAFDDAKDLGIEEEQMKKLNAVQVEQKIMARKRVISDQKMADLWVDYKPILIANQMTAGATGNSKLEQACIKRKQLIDAYTRAGKSKMVAGSLAAGKGLTDADLLSRTQEMITEYTTLKDRISILGGDLTQVGGDSITQADAASDNPSVGMLTAVKNALETERLKILADFKPKVVDDVKKAVQIDTISNAALRNLLEKRKISSQRESDLDAYEKSIVDLRQELVTESWSPGDTESAIRKHIDALKTGTVSILERAKELNKQLDNYDPALPPTALIGRAEKLVQDVKIALKVNEDNLALLTTAAAQGTGLQKVKDDLLASAASSIVSKPLEDNIIKIAIETLANINLGQTYPGETPGHDFGKTNGKEDEMSWLKTMKTETKQIIGDIIIQELTRTEDAAYDKKAHLRLKSEYDGLDVRAKLLMSNRNELMVELNGNTMFGKVIVPKTPVIIGSWARFQFNYRDGTALATMNKLFPKGDFPELYDGDKILLGGTLYMKLAVLQRDGENDAVYEDRKAQELRQVGDNKFFIEEVWKQLTMTTVGKLVGSWNSTKPSVLRNPLLKNKPDVKLITNIVGISKEAKFTVDGVREIGIQPSDTYDYSFLYAPSLTGFASDLKDLGLSHEDIVIQGSYVPKQSGNAATVNTDGDKLTKLFFVLEKFANVTIDQEAIRKMVEDFEIARNEKNYSTEQMNNSFARNFVRKFAPIPYIQPVDLAYIRSNKTDALQVGKRQYYLQCKNNEYTLACSIFGHSWDINDLSSLRKNLYLYKDESVLNRVNQKVVSTSNFGGGLQSLMDTDDEDVGSKFRFIPNI